MPEEEAERIVGYLQSLPDLYTPFSFWEEQDCYLQCVVEKIDLRELFKDICARYPIPIANGRGWSDLNLRAGMMKRFAYWEARARGKRPVLLYAGGFDPVGLQMSDVLLSNMDDIAQAVGWSPRNLIVDRFALNIEFIEKQRLTWIDGLKTGGKDMDLADPRHRDHRKPYVQEYLKRYCPEWTSARAAAAFATQNGRRVRVALDGSRKVEANAMVARAEESRALLLETIHKYLHPVAPGVYRAILEPHRDRVRREVLRLLRRDYGGLGS